MKVNNRICIGIVLGLVVTSLGLVGISEKVKAAGCKEERDCTAYTTSCTPTRCASEDILCTWKYVGIQGQPYLHPVSEGYFYEPSDDPPIFGVCYDLIKCNITSTECEWPYGDPEDEFFCENGPWIGDYPTVTFIDEIGTCD